MPRLSTNLLALLATFYSQYGAIAQSAVQSPVQSPGPARAPAEGRRIVLFGASWCAPCRVEMRALAGLAEAALPERLVVAWIDREAVRPGSGHPANVDLLPPDRAARLMRDVAGDVTGLPYAVMLDERGRRCAEWRAGLRPADIPALRALCH